MGRRCRVVRRAAHHDPLAVAAGGQDRAFAGRVRPGPILPEVLDVLGHVHVHVLQAVHRLFQVQDARDGTLGLAEGLLDTQPLVPVLQDVGEVRRGQLQAVVQGHEVDLLALAAALDRALQGEDAEDGHVAARVQFGQPFAGLAIGQGEGVAEVAGALPGEELAEGSASEAEQPLPDAAFDIVDSSSLGGGGADKGEQFAGQIVECLGVVEGGAGCEHGQRPPWRANRGLCLSMLSSRRPLVSSAERHNYLLNHGLPESGRPVTPK